MSKIEIWIHTESQRHVYSKADCCRDAAPSQKTPVGGIVPCRTGSSLLSAERRLRTGDDDTAYSHCVRARDHLSRVGSTQRRSCHGFWSWFSMRGDATRRDGTRRDATRRDATRRDATRRDATRRDATRRDATRRDATRRDATRRDATRRDATRRDATRRDATRRDATRRDATRRDVFTLLYLEFIKKKIYKEKTIHHIITAKVTAFPGSSLDVTIFVLHTTLVMYFSKLGIRPLTHASDLCKQAEGAAIRENAYVRTPLAIRVIYHTHTHWLCQQWGILYHLAPNIGPR